MSPPEHHLNFKLKDGTTVDAELIFLALDRPNCVKKLRGAQLTFAWLNEVKELDKSIFDMAYARCGRYPTNPITVFPDPAGQQRKTSANGNTDIKILEMAGFTTRYHRSHPLVKDRINACNSLFFKRDNNTTKFKIDPKCKHTIKSLRNWSYKPESMVPQKDGWDHACDSLGYLIEFLYPIQKPIAKILPQRFGHQLA